MPILVLIALYGIVLLYAALTYFLGDLVPLATIVLGFGLLIIPYYLLEWVATPVVALVVGFQARWSLGTALVAGLPLVVLFTAVTPVVSSGSAALAIPVPWLAVFAETKSKVLPLIWERLTWWGALYACSMVAGLLSRRVRPLAVQ